MAAKRAGQGDSAQAINLYRRALDMDYGQIDWRLQLAKVLGDTQQFPAAVRELQVCLRLRPQWAEAQSMLADYSTRGDGHSGAGVAAVSVRQ
jgi:predicted Zn-dependent protease